MPTIEIPELDELRKELHDFKQWVATSLREEIDSKIGHLKVGTLVAKIDSLESLVGLHRGDLDESNRSISERLDNIRILVDILMKAHDEQEKKKLGSSAFQSMMR